MTDIRLLPNLLEQKHLHAFALSLFCIMFNIILAWIIPEAAKLRDKYSM